MKRAAPLGFGLGLLFLLAGVRPAAAVTPAPGSPGYSRWQGYHCDEVFAKLKAHQPLTLTEGEAVEACEHLVGPKYVPLPPSEQANPGNGWNEPFGKSAAKIPPGTFLPPKPPKQYPHPKIFRIPPRSRPTPRRRPLPHPGVWAMAGWPRPWAGSAP
jgi:hypothetical protein